MIVKKYQTKIISDVPIIDVEIGNDISENWDYEASDIITFGVIHGNDVTIIQREKIDNIEDFKNEIKKIMKKLPTCYAFNFNMEKGAMYGFLGEKYFFEELKPWKGKGWNKNKFFEEVGQIIKITDEINDPLKGNSAIVMDKYAENKYDEVMGHNLTCLIKEAYILKYKFQLIKKYKDKIDDKGWFNE